MSLLNVLIKLAPSLMAPQDVLALDGYLVHTQNAKNVLIPLYHLLHRSGPPCRTCAAP